MNTEKQIYKLLEDIGIIDAVKNSSYAKFVSDYGLMDLSVDKLADNIIALSHYYTSNGDLVPDPDMEVEIDFKNKKARALSFQNAYMYQEAINEKIQQELNDFLIQWLSNIKASNYQLQEEEVS